MVLGNPGGQWQRCGDLRNFGPLSRRNCSNSKCRPLNFWSNSFHMRFHKLTPQGFAAGKKWHESFGHISYLCVYQQTLIVLWKYFVFIRSADPWQLLFVPRHNLSFGSRVFRVSAPKVWNTLPLHIRQSQITLRIQTPSKDTLLPFSLIILPSSAHSPTRPDSVHSDIS